MLLMQAVNCHPEQRATVILSNAKDLAWDDARFQDSSPEFTLTRTSLFASPFAKAMGDKLWLGRIATATAAPGA
jgi:hypothetical protein